MHRSIAFWSLFALCVPQALWVKRTAPRFGGAPGPRSGVTGGGKAMRLVGLGDSVIDGVGCSSLDAALVGRTAEALACRMSARVEWRVTARTGANTRQIRRLLTDADVRQAEFVMISTGVNDVTGLTRLRTFRAELGALLDDIESQAPDATVAVNGLPPMHVFPALPQPLRFTLGLRARQLDEIVAEVTAARTGAVRIPLGFDAMDDEPAARFAPDGYHPSESSCGELAAMVADLLIDVRTR
ncbi:MAG: SGNH/GDSL hydrolase family protein [Candidatus Wenzhouxiangella sp. M2_3B_020]